MKDLLTILFCLLTSVLVFSQENSFKEYSYTELFEMIEAEQDSVFQLSNALIKYDLQTDSLFMIDFKFNLIKTPKRTETLIVDKEIHLDNVHFQNHIFRGKDNNTGYLANIHFKKEVAILNSAAVSITNCVFDDILRLGGSGQICSTVNEIEKTHKIKDYISVEDCTFNNGMRLFFNCNFQDDILKTNVNFRGNTFYPNRDTYKDVNLTLSGRQFGLFILFDNKFLGESSAEINNSGGGVFMSSNDFGSVVLISDFSDLGTDGRYELIDNTFRNISILGFPVLSQTSVVDLSQFKEGFLSTQALNTFRREEFIVNKDTAIIRQSVFSFYNNKNYRSSFEKATYQSDKVYKAQSKELALLRGYYKLINNKTSENKIYIQLKDLETKRLKFQYQTTPTFKTFFSWKINQFLKIFSSYGTEPAKAIVFSVYVILCFALIYLFFPNSWDKHGKNRIVDRYNFFFKYMKQKAGIHVVYLDGQKEELMSYDQFKENITTSKQKVPKFFTATALPLYNWAISGTKISASFLKRIDIMKGSWNDLPQSKQIWISILLIGAFVLAIIYDLFIKMLNALMLSINTFTTLGFGEIPIKGLPRYLAIIQGFIGWFMLTIFSVSLISQLLN